MSRRLALATLALLALPAGAEASPIAYSHGERLWEVRADSSGRQPLTTPPRRASDRAPAWSPDGRALAFVRWFDPPGLARDAATLHVAVPAGATVALTRSGYADSPTWAPDGRRLAFAHRRGRGSAILTIGADGRGARTLVRRRLGDRLRQVSSPAWSPDGRWIAYEEELVDARGRVRTAIYVVRPDGTGRRRLIAGAASPAWSPDGSRLAVSSVRDRNGSHRYDSDADAWDGEIYVYDRNGGNPVRLTRHPGHDDDPAWSPDGTRIAFASDRNLPSGFGEENAELYSVGVDGACLTWLTNGSPSSDEPAWRPGVPGGAYPGVCGAVPRPALVEVATGWARRVSGHAPHWLGRSFGPALLADAAAYDRQSTFFYDDCAAYDPGACPEVPRVVSFSVCRLVVEGVFEIALAQAHAYRIVRGALVASYEGERGLSVLTGRTEVTLSGVGSYDVPDAYPALEGHVLALRPYGAPDATRQLGPPRLPRAFARQLDRTVRLHARLGSVTRTARRLGVAPARVRFRLRFARALAPLGPVGTVACPAPRPLPGPRG